MKPIFALATCLLLGGAARAEKAPQLVLENLDGSTFSLVEALKKDRWSSTSGRLGASPVSRAYPSSNPSLKNTPSAASKY